MDGIVNEDAKPTDAVEFLRGRLGHHIERFTLMREHNRDVSIKIRMGKVVLGSCATIVLGIYSYVQTQVTWLPAVALIITSSIPILEAWEAFFDPRWLYVRYTTTVGQLNGVLDDLEFTVLRSKSLPEDQIDNLYRRLEDILQETNADWATKRVKYAEDKVGKATPE